MNPLPKILQNLRRAPKQHPMASTDASPVTATTTDTPPQPRGRIMEQPAGPPVHEWLNDYTDAAGRSRAHLEQASAGRPLLSHYLQPAMQVWSRPIPHSQHMVHTVAARPIDIDTGSRHDAASGSFQP